MQRSSLAESGMLERDGCAATISPLKAGTLSRLCMVENAVKVATSGSNRGSSDNVPGGSFSAPFNPDRCSMLRQMPKEGTLLITLPPLAADIHYCNLAHMAYQ